jgi:hypothetical protein
MLKIICFIIILYIIIQNLFYNTDTPNDNYKSSPTFSKNILDQHSTETNLKQKNGKKYIAFDNPNPWTSLMIDEQEEFPYLFHIKLKIPSLNDYDNWKRIIPNLEFNAQTGELIIPSKDEPSALAIANLISINFLGQMTLQDILDKNLIQISINKSKTYEMVQNRLREQLNETLYGKVNIKSASNYEKDLNIVNKPLNNKIDLDITNKPLDNKIDLDIINKPLNNKINVEHDNNEILSSNEYHISSNNHEDMVAAFTGNDYSYI